ncbi:BTB/POZ domain-containing protein At5g17580-like [Magnolia sinica]|uniref:BTB/POZ domain-containing protein At5g17580-like n=1 Tax=Magnolia sinica TaxID=86752 RepID=UPI00265851ED|nr:BTB/POZ domain-containing protein At5g17580-like [Magnolia sinica]
MASGKREEDEKQMPIYGSRESWFSTNGPLPDVNIEVHGVIFRLNQKKLISRSAKLAKILKESQNQHVEQSYAFKDIPADVETFELVAKFCYGYEPELSSENTIPLTCVASYLEMSEDHSFDNLFEKTISFLYNIILSDWNESVKALRTCENVLNYAAHLGLIDACLDSIARRACADPRLLGNPINNPMDDVNNLRPSARRKLFVVDWLFEDLTTLTLPLYELAMLVVIRNRVPPKYIGGSLFRYAKKHADVSIVTVLERVSIDEKSPQRDVIEVVEKLLPDNKGVLPCKCLFEILRWAIAMQSCYDCRRGLEVRIGKQLDEAVVKDLLIPCYNYSRETRYDVDCVIRILKNFYANYTDRDPSGLIAVSELIDKFLVEIARDVNLKKEKFISLVEMSAVASNETGRCSDGVYYAIDAFFCAHTYLTEFEREELCQVLDCNRMTPATCEHAARNEHLPLRVVVNVLFMGQLKLQDTIMGALSDSDGGFHEDGEEKNVVGDDGGVRVREEMEMMDSRVMELEKECCRMKREIKRGRGGDEDVRIGRKLKKESLWKEMKRKFGCMNSLHECSNSNTSNNSGHAKKVHRRNGV